MPPGARKPTAILKLNGSLDRHPERERARKHEPANDQPVGDPPDDLTKDERAIWREIVRNSAPGVLNSADRMVVELLARLYAKFRRRETLSGPELGKMLSCLSLLGMSPVDRSRISLTPQVDKANPYSEFAKVV